MRDAAEGVEKAAVTILEAFAPWYDFLEGWRDKGSRTYVARLLIITYGGGDESMGDDRRWRGMLFIVMLFSYKIHGTIWIHREATNLAECVQKLFVKWINPCCPIVQTGGGRLWIRCLGGEEDLPPCLLTTVKPSALVIEL